VKNRLGGQIARERAAELILGTKVNDVAVRKELYAADAATLEKRAGSDPLLAVYGCSIRKRGRLGRSSKSRAK